MKYEKGTFTTVVTKSMEGITCEAQCIYFWLCSYANNETRECYPSVKVLMRLCNLSERTIRDRLKELEKTGRILIEKRNRDDGSFASNLYTIVAIPLAGDAVVGAGGAPTQVHEAQVVGAGGAPHELKEEEPKEYLTKYSLKEKASPQSFGNEEINKALEAIKEETGMTAGGKMPRIHISNLLKRMKKDYPGNDPVLLIRQIVKLAMSSKSSYLASGAASPDFLYYNYQKILLESNKIAEKTATPSF